jgi:hypothetical protein
LTLRQRAGRDERRNFFRDATPDPGQIRQIELAAFNELRNRIRVIRNGARSVPVRANLERVAGGDLEEIGDFTEQSSDVSVLHDKGGNGRHRAAKVTQT